MLLVFNYQGLMISNIFQLLNQNMFMKQTIRFLLLAVIFAACSNDQTAADSSSTTMDSASTEVNSRDYSFGDDKYVQMAKQTMQDLSSGNVDGFLSTYADNAIYRFSGGDSLNGKQAITDYWKKRRLEVIDSLSYSGEVWLPINVSKPMTPNQLTGNYALTWNMVHAKYKSGKSMSQRMHMVFHFNDSDKVDRVTQYLDRVPVLAAQ
jgi:ketosteroid isomerase-like protein